MFNIYVETEKSAFMTDWFHYNRKEHILTFHIPSFPSLSTKVEHLDNVEVEIKIDRPLVFLNVKPYKE